MLRKLPSSVLWILGFVLLGSAARADIDGPDMYVYVEVSVREATIEGMRQRLALLQGSEYSLDADNVIDAATRVHVADVYAQFGTTAGAHLAYGTRNTELIESWLNENPMWRSRYTALDSEFRALSEQLNASRRPQ